MKSEFMTACVMVFLAFSLALPFDARAAAIDELEVEYSSVVLTDCVDAYASTSGSSIKQPADIEGFPSICEIEVGSRMAQVGWVTYAVLAVGFVIFAMYSSATS